MVSERCVTPAVCARPRWCGRWVLTKTQPRSSRARMLHGRYGVYVTRPPISSKHLFLFYYHSRLNLKKLSSILTSVRKIIIMPTIYNNHGDNPTMYRRLSTKWLGNGLWSIYVYKRQSPRSPYTSIIILHTIKAPHPRSQSGKSMMS